MACRKISSRKQEYTLLNTNHSFFTQTICKLDYRSENPIINTKSRGLDTLTERKNES